MEGLYEKEINSYVNASSNDWGAISRMRQGERKRDRVSVTGGIYKEGRKDIA